MTKFEHIVFPEHNAVNLKTTMDLIRKDGESLEYEDFVSSEIHALRAMSDALRAVFAGEAGDAEVSFKADVGELIMGVFPHVKVKDVEHKVYSGIPMVSEKMDGEDPEDDVIFLIGTSKAAPDVLFVRKGTKSSLLEMIGDDVSDLTAGEFIEDVVIDSIAIHKDSLDDLDAAIDVAEQELKAAIEAL